VIVSVNGHTLEGRPDPSEFNRADRFLVVTGVVRYPECGELLGFFLNDGATGAGGEFVRVDTLRQAWERSTGADGVRHLRGDHTPRRRPD
jgi:hypothetical protein